MAPAASGQRQPPTGPKALRTPNGIGSTARPAPNGVPGKISIALPTVARAPPSGPRTNGFPVALPAESSRQAQMAARPPPPPPPQEPPPPPRSSSAPSRRRSRTPEARSTRFSPFLPVEDAQRAKISISFALPNGKTRPLPPHQVEPRVSSPTAHFFPGADPPISHKSDPRSESLSPERSRVVRPPSSPKRISGLLGRRPATPPPPPPPDSLPPPPPSPGRRPESPPRAPSSPKRPGVSIRRITPPPPATAAPSLPPSPGSPPRVRRAAPPPPPAESSQHSPQDITVPPAFHFRELPDASAPPSYHFRRLSPREESDGEDSARSRTSSPPAWRPEEYRPPPSAFRRDNSGSYYVVGGPSRMRFGKSGESKKNSAAYTRYDGVERDGSIVEPKDPRLKTNAWKRGVGSAAQVSKLYRINYQWDEKTSFGPKPPDPPTAVLITSLSPLTTADQIRKFLAPFGRIRDLDVKMDKKSGSPLGICWIKFDGPHHGRSGSAHDVAKTVCTQCEGKRIHTSQDEKIHLVLDGRGLRAEKAVKEELDRRYAPKPKPQPQSKALPAPTLELPHPVPKPSQIFQRGIPPRPRWNAPPRLAPTQQLSSSFTDRPFDTPLLGRNRYERDTYRGRRSPSSDYSSRSGSRERRSDSSDTEDDHRRTSLKLQREHKVYDVDVDNALKENGHPAIFIDAQSLPTDANIERPLHDHFQYFKPSRILRQSQGWYILFPEAQTAERAMKVIQNSKVNGWKLSMSLKDPAIKLNAVVSMGGAKSWRHQSFKRNQLVKKAPRQIRIPSPVSSENEPNRQKATPEPEHKPEPEPVLEAPQLQIKRKAKSVAAKGAKKARIETVEITSVFEPEVVEIKIDEVSAKVEKPRKKAQTPLDKLFADGTLEDEEDAYWMGQVLANEPMMEEEEEVLLPEEHPLHHLSGSWRAEGFKRVPKTQKSRYLPQRNRAQASAEEAGALTTGRTARVTGRRLVQDMTVHKSTTAESDLFAFNQLRIRKKQLKFARSAIEGYGLYAQETIQPGEMVCEYVGELVRSSVADLREHQYLKQGIGSSYLFRIDGDIVCDATFRGSVSRLINHSCDPSATAKIISINGQSKIVIYAKRMLHPGEEILYDYKFPLESDPALRVPCLCGAATCRGWLN